MVQAECKLKPHKPDAVSRVVAVLSKSTP